MDDKTIQAILRHADCATTMNSYVLSVPESVQKAMELQEQKWRTLVDDFRTLAIAQMAREIPLDQLPLDL